MNFVMPAAVHANSLYTADADQLNANIIAAIALLRNIHQPRCRAGQGRIGAKRLYDVISIHRVVKTIRAQQQSVAHRELMFTCFDVDEHVCSQGAAKQMRRRRGRSFLRRDQTHAHLFTRNRMIACQRNRKIAANEIAPGITNMRNDGAIKPQRARDDGSRHVAAAWVGCETRLKDFAICRLNQLRQKICVGLFGRSFAKSVGKRAYGDVRSHLAAILSTNAVGYNEKPPVRAGKLRGRRNELAETILVILADNARVGQLREFKLQHLVASLSEADVLVRGRDPLVALANYVAHSALESILTPMLLVPHSLPALCAR